MITVDNKDVTYLKPDERFQDLSLHVGNYVCFGFNRKDIKMLLY